MFQQQARAGSTMTPQKTLGLNPSLLLAHQYISLTMVYLISYYFLYLCIQSNLIILDSEFEIGTFLTVGVKSG